MSLTALSSAPRSTTDDFLDDLLGTGASRLHVPPTLQILNKQNRLITYTPNAAQADFLRKRTGRDLVLKARQLGFSTAIQADHFLSAITRTTMAATLAHDDPTTQKLRRMAKRFYDSLSSPPPRGLDNATTTTYPQTGSEVTIATAGSVTVGRGGTYSHVHGSEVAFWKDAESLMAGILQGVPLDGQIVLESTPNGAQGWFYDRCMEALRGEGAWTLHFYPWWWDADYRVPLDDGEGLDYRDDERALVEKHGLTPEQMKWRRVKQKELGALFPQEYAEDPITCFLTSGHSVFGDFAHALYTPTDDTPPRGHFVVGGVDWGQENDYTVLSIWDADERRERLLLSLNQMRWGDMRARIREACKRWGVQYLVVEKNSASSNIEDLQNEFEADGVNCTIQSFTMTNPKKADLVVNFHNTLHQDGGKVLDDLVANAELRAFVSTQTPNGIWTYAAAGNGHDDTVIARLLANYACTQRIPENW